MPLKKYDVFLSFRGEDTRDNFTSHLYDALSRAKVETYMDNRLEKGDGISQALIKAIEESLVSIVIFSENYASSKWCLDEICMILECKRDHGQIVIPVFYKVDPSDVRKQTGSYKEAFAKHEQDLNNSDDDKLQKWRCALTEAANLGGWDLQTYRNESTFIKDIVKDVLKKLDIRYPIELLKGVVGIEENYQNVELLLEIGSTQDIRVIGIWGMGGIGKTTLACALYAKLFYQFEGHCFLDCVREQSENNGLAVLRNRLFSELLDDKNLCVDAPNVKSQFLTRRLRCKKVLIVLDDVATPEQLKYLIGDYDCMAPGSRVIVTTRDKRIFSHVNSSIYEVKELSDRAALQIFCLNAFNETSPKNEYEKLSESVVKYCKGNPLALRILGSRLRSRSTVVWKCELRKLKRILDENIHKVLKLSFDGLDRIEQNLFLDIACFFKGEYRDQVTSLLDACDFYVAVGIENLIDKSLITISNFNNTIQMHDLIQEMGWEIVRQDSIKVLGRRSRLWYYEEVRDVLENNGGTKVVEGLVLDVSKINDLHLSINSFTEMSEIRILKFYSSTRSEGCKIYLPNGLYSLSGKLRLLEWPGYCLESLPSSFCAEKLVKLVMSCSNIKKLWNGVLNLENLKEIDLSCSKDLVELPDLSRATRLEVLCLVECISLREVHPSILSLDNLWNLDLHGCTEIRSLETEVHSKSLRVIRLSNCSSLKKFSVFSNELETLWLDGTVIQELPTSIWRCEKLEHLSLSGCDKLGSFGIGSKSSPDTINASLTFLCLFGCKLVNESNLRLILDGMRSLTELLLEDCCNLGALPDCIGSLTSLERLHLSGSINVEMLSPNIKNLLKLEVLWLDNCRKLVSLPELPPSLEILKGINCSSLRTNFNTQFLLVVNRDDYSMNARYVILPGSQVPDKMFMFRGEGDSITFPQLPNYGNICRFICCIILPYIPDNHTGEVECCINEHYSQSLIITLSCHTSILDHLLLFSIDSFDSLACDPNNITFEFSYRNDGSWNMIEIKRCGFFPVYAFQDQQQTIPTEMEEQNQNQNMDPDGVVGSKSELKCKAVSLSDAAATKIQKVYKSYRTRRNLADCAVVVEVLWKELDFDSVVPRTMTKREMFFGLSIDEKAQKLALQHWLEAIDPRHRYGHNLHLYYDIWFDSQRTQPFFYWLDIGDGKEINLEKCPRSTLHRQCIKYLGPNEREEYEVIVEKGKLVFRQDGRLVDTDEKSKWIFVLSTTRALYVGRKQKGTFQHSSFLAGGATTAAGRMVTHEGVLEAIWPYSVYNHPTEENFKEFISFLEEHNVDLTSVKSAIDDDNPSFIATNESQQTMGPSSASGINVNDSNMVTIHENDDGGVFNLSKRLSCKWSTGAGPRIVCVRDYPKRLQSRAMEQVNLSPKVRMPLRLDPHLDRLLYIYELFELQDMAGLEFTEL